MNRNILKYIAVIAMLCDHIGLVFVGMDKPLGVAMRVFARALFDDKSAFPLYASRI